MEIVSPPGQKRHGHIRWTVVMICALLIHCINSFIVTFRVTMVLFFDLCCSLLAAVGGRKSLRCNGRRALVRWRAQAELEAQTSSLCVETWT